MTVGYFWENDTANIPLELEIVLLDKKCAQSSSIPWVLLHLWTSGVLKKEER